MKFLKVLLVACVAGLPYMASAEGPVYEPDTTTATAEAGAGEQNKEMARAIGHTSVTCNSGWPGTRGCYWRIESATDIVPGSIQVEIDGHNGEIGHSAVQVGPRAIDFTASVHEGNAFGPGDNTTRYDVFWLRL